MQTPKTSPKSAFTLTELIVVIVVIVVIVIMTAILVPAVNSLGKSTRLVTGGNLVANMVHLARQTATSKNTLSALVVLGNQGVEEDFRAVTVMQYTAGGGGWSQVSAWEVLPSGIVFDTDETESTFLAHTPKFPFVAGPPAQDNPPVQFHGAPVADPQGYRARIFTPTGSLQDEQYGAQLRLIEGYIEKGKLVRTHPGAGGKPTNYYDVTIIGATGIPKIGRP